MNPKLSLSSLIIGAALASFALPSNACFTVIVGKNLSKTDEIMVGHNEDNENRIMSNQYYVPPMTHKKGELLTFEASAAKIPQVEKTNGYWWEQTLHPAGYSYSDGFFNDHGVLITSNNCNLTIEKDEKTTDGGIGYGIRRLLAERATSARDGVKLAIQLVSKYGYRHQGRTYTIADKNEAWQLALLKGGRYLARKVGDNEVTLMSNAFSLGKVDLNDKNNVIYSPDLVTHAIEKGTYKPAKAGDYSDFNFRNAYQLPERINADRNTYRVRTGLLKLTGKKIDDPLQFPTAIKLDRKLSVGDVREILRQTNPWDERKSGWYHEYFKDPSNGGTFDSAVYVLRKDPRTSYTWRTSGRPDSQFSYPQFMLAGPSAGQSYLSVEQGKEAQFRSRPDQFDYSPNRTVFTFINHQNILDWNQKELKDFPAKQKSFEDRMNKDFQTALTRADKMIPISEDKAMEKMREFNADSFNRALGATAAELDRNNKYTIIIGANELPLGGEGTVKVTLLSSKGFDATKLDKSKTYFGDGYPDNSIHYNNKRAQPKSVEFIDVNGDKLKDAVIEFPIKGATEYTFPSVLTQLYLWSVVDGKPVVAFDTVKIKK